MPIGYHPDLVNGALIGRIVTKRWSAPIGDETIETTGEDENGSPLPIVIPNQDYVPPHDVTLIEIGAALQTAGITFGDLFYSGASAAELADGKERVCVQITVAGHEFADNEQRDAARAQEATLRSAIDSVLQSFA
jgi:hypothetical protein